MIGGEAGTLDWGRIQEVFHAALEREGAARLQYLTEACLGDARLRAEVESLLAYADAGPLGEPAEMNPGQAQEFESFGSYRLLRPLGQGGMGTVYLAERTGAGFTQVVALKLLRRDLFLPLGLAPQMEERFARERHILARLEHPGIARLIDGGYGPGGQPYLAMEFVEGLPLTDYVRKHALSLEARLELFIEICDAVHFAHQRLVIHRDLKPSNILVPDSGAVKLVDFGIATFVETEDEESPPEATATRTGAWLTPNYASPEQLRRGRVTTLSDVYSLGVILYELLAEARPYEASELTPGGLEDVVCRRVPDRPSTRSATPQLARRLRGDLDTIALKALAKEPERRYRSAQDLAADVRRHLDHEPVLARPDSLAYRLSTFARRNRSWVAGAAVAVFALMVGLVTTTWQARVAASARGNAEAALQQSEEVTDFLIGLFSQNDPDSAPVNPALAGGIIRRGVARASQLDDRPAVQGRVLDALGMILLNLGRYQDAVSLVGHGLAIRLGALGPSHADVGGSLRHLGTIQRALGRYHDSEALYRHALEILQRRLGPDHPGVADAQSDLAFLLPYLGRPAEAESIYREVLATRRRVLGPDNPAVANALLRVAEVLRLRGKITSAEALGWEALAIRRRVLGADHPLVGQTLINIADCVAYDSTRLDEAEVLYRDGLAIQRRRLGDRHIALAHGMGNLAAMLASRKRYAEAESLLRADLANREAAYGSEHITVVAARDAFADLRAAEGHLSEAIALRSEDLATRQRILGPEHPSVANGLDGLGRLQLKAGNLAAAESLYVEALAIRRSANGARHFLVGQALAALGEISRRQGRYVLAEARLLEALDIMQQVSPNDNFVRQARTSLVLLYRAWGLPEKATMYLPSDSPSPAEGG